MTIVLGMLCNRSPSMWGAASFVGVAVLLNAARPGTGQRGAGSGGADDRGDWPPQPESTASAKDGPSEESEDESTHHKLAVVGDA